MAQLMLFAGDTHASPLAMPGDDKARKMTAISGRTLVGSWMPSGPVGVCLKTLLATSLWGSTLCFLTWKVKATPQGRLLYQLVPSMPDIDETESGLLRTPAGQEPGIDPARLVDKDGNPWKPGRRAFDKETGRFCQTSLSQQAQMLPTATAQDNNQVRQEGTKRGTTLGGAARNPQMFPTPDVPNGGRSIPPNSDIKGGMTPTAYRDGKKYQVGLQAAVKLDAMLPTPQARDYKSTGDLDGKRFDRKKEQGWSLNLNEVAKLYPTASARDWKDTPGMATEATNPDGSARKRNDQLARRVYSEEAEMLSTVDAGAAKGRGVKSAEGRSRLGGSLHPEFCEWLMGFPKGWTDITE